MAQNRYIPTPGKSNGYLHPGQDDKIPNGAITPPFKIISNSAALTPSKQSAGLPELLICVGGIYASLYATPVHLFGLELS